MCWWGEALSPDLVVPVWVVPVQSCHMANDLVDEAAVYLTTGNPLPSDIESVINWLLNEPFVTAFQSESFSMQPVCCSRHVPAPAEAAGDKLALLPQAALWAMSRRPATGWPSWLRRSPMLISGVLQSHNPA